MSAFLTSLFESIFTPGPTPTLVAATNASFAALQLVLLALLIATYSIHFIILSFLSGGLWIAVNWFVHELEAVKQKEERAKVLRGERRRREKGGGDGEEEEEEEDEEEDADDAGGESGTETERSEGVMSGSSAFLNASRPARRMEQSSASLDGGGKEQDGSSGLAPPSTEGMLKKRRSLGEASGDMSTDSEWDKVEDDVEDKGDI
ncbi:hypothetical protein MMC25_007678 [Agyrium rufum]|nr:hypothetical protein [Agyrium rufum]